MSARPETYLHGHHDSVLRSHRWRTAENSAGYLLARLAPGAHVLDVGCGPGTITADLAARVPDGQVTGIDAAAGVVSVARQEAGRRGQANVRFETGDVYRLAFADGTFDVVHAHQVLQHLSDPVAASIPVTWPSGTRAARSTVIVPGPQPTSSTRAPGASWPSRYPAEFSAVRHWCERSTLSWWPCR